YPQEDVWGWRRTRDGIFLVKSAYYAVVRMKHQNNPSTSASNEDETWKKIWNACVSTESETFWVEGIEGCYPSRSGIKEEGGSRLTPFVQDVGMNRRMCYMLWQLVKKLGGNDWVFNKRDTSVEWSIRKAVSLGWEYKNAWVQQQHAEIQAPRMEDRWKTPQEGVAKLNYDMAKREDGRVGDGGATGLKTEIEAGFQKLEVEVDCLALPYALRKKKMETSAYGLILKDIRYMCSLCQEVSFSFVKRNGNKVTHALAKYNLDNEGLLVWLEEAPSTIMDCVYAHI
ncbi:Deoxyguanosinetriphosphate triphosphohydrolase-like protein, partial [Bienertia sinuspersici]